MVIWIIGLSGAGKSTLAAEVVARVRRHRANVVLIDGDQFRALFGNDLGHSAQDRRKNADRICNLCKFLDDQGVDVVCAILSLFTESRTWNRDNLAAYYEVFIDAPLDSLIERDPKDIYRRFHSGELTDVAGLDIEFPYPNDADLVIQNSGSREALLEHASAISEKILSSAR